MDGALIVNAQHKPSGGYLNSENSIGAISIRAGELTGNGRVARGWCRGGPLIFSLNRRQQLLDERPTLIRVDHDCGALAAGRIETKIGQETVIATGVSEAKSIAIARATPSESDKIAACRFIRQLRTQHGG